MPDILQGLLARRDKIAKMPESAQRKIWSFAFGQSVAPRLRAATEGGAKLENEDVAKERFVTSMLGKPQTPSAEPAVAASGFLDDTQAFLASIGSGFATEAKGLLKLGQSPEIQTLREKARPKGLTELVTGEAPAPHEPTTWQGKLLTPKDQSGMGVLGLEAAENLYNENVVTSPTASKVGAAVGHAVPELLAFESGASLVPKLAGPVEAGMTKAPALVRGAQQLLRTGAGTAGMTMMQGKDVTGGQLAAETLGFSLFDAMTHGFFRSMRSGGPDAASTLSNLRGTIAKLGGGKVTKEAVSTFNDVALGILQRENPQAVERIAKGERVEDVLTYEQQVDLSKKVGVKQAEIEAVAKQNDKTLKTAEKIEKKAADGLKAMQARAQKVLDSKAQRLKNQALQREISAYAKATGKVPAEGSEAMKSLQSGAKAAEISAAEKASVVQRVAQATDVNDAIAITEEAPALQGMVEDLQALAPPAEQVEKQRTIDVTEKPRPTAKELNAAAKEREKGLLAKAEEHRVATEAQRAALPGGQGWVEPKTEKVAKPKSAVKQKIAASAGPKAYEEFGITLNPTTWTTPEDVIKAKADAKTQLKAAIDREVAKLQEGLANKTISEAQARTMGVQLNTKMLKAAKSIENVQAPGVSREARDMLRNRAKAAEAKRAVGEKQAAAEKLGTSSQNAEMTEQQAVDEIDTLVKIGFGSTARQAIAKRIIKEVEDAGGGAIDKLEALQDAYDAMKKAGK